ncbi:hypothetical protein PQR29_04045 [Paraburkholderia strydomiana]|uniref:hypothetical protein n=1 Tax=Paraburkholderia strydomiana TaxID=1245417 RepID=UPI0038B9FC55
MFRLIGSIPVLGALLKIANTYAYGGDYRASEEFAGLALWIKRFAVPLMLALVLTLCTVWPIIPHAVKSHELSFSHATDFVQKPGVFISSVLPSLLGFGIGVYALIFGLAEPFVRQFRKLIDEQIKAGEISHGSVLMLNSDLAFPLIVMVVGIAVGALQQANLENQSLILITWVMFWYSLIVMIEMISVIFRLAENSLLDKGLNGDENTKAVSDVTQGD